MALLVTSYLPGVLLADLKPTLDDAGQARVGQALGTLLGRLAHVALPRAGLFHDPDLGIDPLPEEAWDLTLWTERAVPDLTGWDEADLAGLRSLATDAQALEAFKKLAHLEGIIPALESAHAIAEVMRRAPRMQAKDIVVVNLSGRGDKDVAQVAAKTGLEMPV